ncbi:MAG: hypothetical protein ACOX3C_05800 [Bacilli bacterium]
MARNRGERSIAGTVFLWFVAVLMIIGAAVGIKWVKNTEFNLMVHQTLRDQSFLFQFLPMKTSQVLKILAVNLFLVR